MPYYPIYLEIGRAAQKFWIEMKTTKTLIVLNMKDILRSNLQGYDVV